MDRYPGAQGFFNMDGAGQMIRKQVQESRIATTHVDRITGPQLTVFAIPKPFKGTVATIQENAIASWASLQPHAEVILFGDEDDTELQRVANRYGARVLPLRANRFGTPLVNDAFAQVRIQATGHTLCYANCDMVFGPELLQVADDMQNSQLVDWLGIGQRIELDVTDAVDMSSTSEVNKFFDLARTEGRVSSIVCKEFFVFPGHLFDEIPDFAVGRGNWDNWVVAHAKSRSVPVVDLTRVLPAIHQNHDYSHVPGGRKSAYYAGEEARENQRLAGGRNLISGSTANWQLTKSGLKRLKIPIWRMVGDLPRFMALLRNLLFLGYIMADFTFS